MDIRFLTAGGSIEYVRIMDGTRKVQTFPLMGGDLRTALWRACISWAKKEGKGNAEAAALYARKHTEARRLQQRLAQN